MNAEKISNAGKAITRVGVALTWLITVPVLGLLIFGIPGLIIGGVFGLLFGAGTIAKK